MSLRDAKRLFDIAVRLQIYVENVKAHQGIEFGKVIANVETEFRKLLFRVKYKTLDGLTKSELNKLVVMLRASQSEVYSVYLIKVLRQLKAFMQAALIVNRIVSVSSFVLLEENDEFIPTDEQASAFIAKENERNAFIPVWGIAAIAKGNDKLWSNILNEPIPANGVLINPFLKSFSASAQITMENLVRKGYSNSWTVSQTVDEATAQVSKISNQADAVLATSMQHIEAIVSGAVQSALFGQYQWISVIDSGTTDICRGRNKKIYSHGSGPYPPAHIRCRSMTIPYRGVVHSETLASWTKRQSAKVQAMVARPRPMSIEKFGESAAEIITGY